MKYLLSILCLAAVIGCGSSAGPDPVVEKNRVESATKLREAFVRVNGNYDQLSGTEKAELLKLFNGNETNTKQAWDFMKARGAGANVGPSQSGPTSGPATR